MSDCILITGGAGFIGSHLAVRLVREGYRVKVIDSLAEQVHGQTGWPPYLPESVEKVHGDIRNFGQVREALQGVDAVFHFAAAVGVGQSMYKINHYTDVNNRGTAVLLESLTKQPVKKLIIASSMSVYGEGCYRDSRGNIRCPAERNSDMLRAGLFELYHDQEELQPMPTPENKALSPSSIYALSKFDQERMGLMIGAAYAIPTTALRFFNIYGPYQSLSNPYTGVLAIFSSRLLNGRPPLIFEDGRQRRDFVSVHDVCEACLLALESDQSDGEVFNIGSGNNYSIAEIAAKVADVLACPDVPPQITGEYRVGDVRHCFADIGKARDLLGYRPRVSLADGLEELAQWLQSQQAVDRVEIMRRELSSRGLSL